MQNATDRKQNKTLERQRRSKEEQILADVKFLLASRPGRRVFGFILDLLQPDMDYWNSNAAVTGAIAACHDKGRRVEQLIERADPRARLLMRTEDFEEKQQDALERDAVQPKRPLDNSNESGGEE